MDIFRKKEFWFSAALLLACSLLGKYISTFPGLSLIGHLVIALILGMLLQISGGLKKIAKGGSAFISNKFLRLGIILMGFRLNLEVLAENGVKTISLAAIIVTFTIILISYAGRALKVDKRLALLSACGCGVCGAAAVLGVSPILKASEDDEVIAVAIVAILGTVFTLIMVALRPMLGLTDVQFGALAGASLHEIAHAVAAGAAGGEQAENMATIVKLSRVLMLAPLSVILSVIVAKRNSVGSSKEKVKVAIPWFMLGFILASAVGTYAGIPENIVGTLVDLAYIFLGMAMAALGVNVHFGVILQKGQRMFAIAFVGSVVLFLASLGAAKLLF